MLSVLIKFNIFLIFVYNFVFVQSQSEDIQTKIVNGENAIEIIPFQASLRVSIRDRILFGRGHTCGAVLISNRVLLTAAHCLYDGENLRTPFDLRIVLASLNRNEFSSENVIRPIEKIIVHPEYLRGASVRHDIGILFLRSPVDFSDVVQSVEIIDHDIEPLTECQISGWGATEWRGFMPNELQVGNVSIVSRDFCNSSLSYAGTITDGMVCANGIGDRGIIDVCQGDSGGPLICNSKLVGLASFGVQCSYSLNFPGVHTSVYYYKKWIDEEILKSDSSGCGYSRALILACFATIFSLSQFLTEISR